MKQMSSYVIENLVLEIHGKTFYLEPFQCVIFG